MTALLSYRVIAWLCGGCMVGYVVWVTLVPSGWLGAPIFAGVVLLLLTAVLRLGTRQRIDYWQVKSQPPQVPRITALVAAVIGLQIAMIAVVAALDLMNGVASWSIYLAAFTGVPLIALATGWIALPKRCLPAPRLEVILVGALAIMVAAIWAYLQTIAYDGQRASPSAIGLLSGTVLTLWGATAEELIFWVILLTALVKASGSRLQALVLSSALFGAIHVPAALSEPFLAQDWTMLSAYAAEVWPELIGQIGLGFLFGGLWLRTGSMSLIIVAHAICNMGPLLVGGLSAIA